MKEHVAIERQAIDRAYDDLVRAGIRCEKIAREKKTRAGIRGSYKGWPFLVYVSFVGREGNFAALITTRYKSRDWVHKPPQEVLKQEG